MGPLQWAALPHAFCEGHAAKDIAGGTDVGRGRGVMWVFILGSGRVPQRGGHWPLGQPLPLAGPRRHQDTVPLGVWGPGPPGDAPLWLLTSQGEILPFLSLQPRHLGALVWRNPLLRACGSCPG